MLSTMAIYSAKRIAWVVVLVFLGSFALAQQASFVQAYADSESVTGTQTIYLLGIATGRLEPTAPFSEDSIARATIREAQEYATAQTLSLSEFAFLLATYFTIEPGMMGRLFPGPRYALRDLRREQIILYEADASSPVPGDVALRTLRRALDWEVSP
jgi:hypothetical protein